MNYRELYEEMVDENAALKKELEFIKIIYDRLCNKCDSTIMKNKQLKTIIEEQNRVLDKHAVYITGKMVPESLEKLRKNYEMEMEVLRKKDEEYTRYFHSLNPYQVHLIVLGLEAEKQRLEKALQKQKHMDSQMEAATLVMALTAKNT